MMKCKGLGPGNRLDQTDKVLDSCSRMYRLGTRGLPVLPISGLWELRVCWNRSICVLPKMASDRSATVPHVEVRTPS